MYALAHFAVEASVIGMTSSLTHQACDPTLTRWGLAYCSKHALGSTSVRARRPGSESSW